MQIDMIISADYVDENSIKDKVVIVIDIFRATSVITTAISNGCTEIIPVLTVEEAIKLRDSDMDKNYLLGGERQAKKIPGFDLSNSPLEYTEEVVKDRSIILTTTNGTKALTRCEGAYKILIGCLLNGNAVAREAIRYNKDIVIVNSGTNGQFSIDDFICTGFILNAMKNNTDCIEMSDICKAAYLTYLSNNISEYIKNARHYKVMMKLNLDADIEFCLKTDEFDIIPEYCKGLIK